MSAEVISGGGQMSGHGRGHVAISWTTFPAPALPAAVISPPLADGAPLGETGFRTAPSMHFNNV